MAFLLDLLNLLTYLPAFRTDQEDIARNINKLKKQEWFNDYYKNEKYVQLLIHDNKVRSIIGSFNTKRIENPRYKNHYQRRINRVLNKQLDKRR